MYELLKQLRLHIFSAWHYRWGALLAAWLVAVASWAFVYSLSEVNEATAGVFIDTDSVLKPLLEGLTVETDIMSEVAMMTEALKSRPNLEKVVRETDLDLRAETPTQMEDLISTLQRSVKIVPGYANLFTISYTDIDRNIAKAVVEVILNDLIQDTLGANRTDTTSAQRFLNEQLQEYEIRLAESEQRLAKFKQKNVGKMPSEGRDYYARLQVAMEELDKVSSELDVAKNRGSELRRQLEGDMPVYFGFSGPGARSGSSQYDKRIEVLEDRLDTFLLNFTEYHPDVIAVKEKIARLEARRRAAMRAIGDVKTDLDQNPVYLRMTSALNEAEVDIAILKGKKDDRQKKVDKLRKLVDTIPQIEAQLMRLNRDYEVTKAQYETMLQRLESARLSEQAELSDDDVEFRIIEPASVPLKPSGPPRVLFLTMGLIAALSTGLGLAFSLYQIRPVFLSREKLSESLAFPVLGVIGMVVTPEQETKQRMGLVLYLALVILLIAAAGGVVAFREPGSRIAQMVIESI
jgi:polysaccharide chain length determinant protein (PEP-CTERM system associated)